MKTNAAWWQPLHIKAALVALPLLAALSALTVGFFHHYRERIALETSQRVNVGLAAYIASHQTETLISPSGAANDNAMKDLAMHVMAINPSVEVFLLNREGRVIGHALDIADNANPVNRTVDLSKVSALLAQDAHAIALPVFGDDPMRPGYENIVSVAPLGEQSAPEGYLYVVLQGAAARMVAGSLTSSNIARQWVGLIAFVTFAAMLVLVIALRSLTLPLRRLVAQAQMFRSEDEVHDPRAPKDEISALRNSFSTMQTRITQQFSRLEESDRLRRELVSNISHDLRTPLSSIQGYIETVLLRRESLAISEREHYLRTALRHVNILSKRVADLFALSKLDAGRVAPTYEAFCLAELLQDSIQSHQLSAQKKGVQLKLSPGSHERAQVVADIALIERVLQNLVDNALRHTASGGTVTLALQRAGDTIEVSVSDTGCGIAREHLPHIFERYWRASAEHASSTESARSDADSQSAGLGLAIVKRIVELHGSVVRVRSELSRGTCFEFALPIRQ